MATVASAARIRLTGLDTEGIDHESPLEDQVVLVYRAVSHYATVNNWASYNHRGVQGRAGKLVMKRIQAELFPKAGRAQLDKLNGLINQVLRKTDAAVCVVHPHGRDETPTWFIADRMPAHIVVVALSHAKNQDSYDATKPRSDKEAKIAWHEGRLTPEEAGENMEPGEVTVTRRTPEELEQIRLNALAEQRQRVSDAHQAAVRRIIELVREHQPVTVMDVAHLLAGEEHAIQHHTTIRDVLRETEAAGEVVSRVETDTEALVRGGGSMPKGRRVLLWGMSPGPVPTRTSLPEGIEPYRAAADWSETKKRERDGWCDIVLEALSYTGTQKDRPPRLVKDLRKRTGLTREQITIALDRLISLELVEKRNSRYYLFNKKPAVTATNPVQEPDAVDTVQATEPATPAPARVTQGDDTDLIAQAHAILDKLALANGEPAELEELRRENERLNGEVARLGRVVTSLRAALTDLG